MLAGGLSGCARTRDTGSEAPGSPYSVGNQGSTVRGTPPSPSRNAMPYPLDTLREEFDAAIDIKNVVEEK